MRRHSGPPSKSCHLPALQLKKFQPIYASGASQPANRPDSRPAWAAPPPAVPVPPASRKPPPPPLSPPPPLQPSVNATAATVPTCALQNVCCEAHAARLGSSSLLATTSYWRHLLPSCCSLTVDARGPLTILLHACPGMQLHDTCGQWGAVLGAGPSWP